MSSSYAAVPARQSQNGVVLQWANTIAVIVTVVFNILSQAIPIGRATNAVIANQYNPVNFFLPANYVFSIWGVIFTGMVVFAWWQSRPAQRENPRLYAIGWWFVIGSLGNIGWLLLFQNYLFPHSMIPLATLLITLGIIYVRIRQVQRPASIFEKVALFGFISLYFAWSAVATVANGAFILLGWQIGVETVAIASVTADMLSQYQLWGAIMLVVAGLIGAGVAYVNRDIVYAGVFVWAYVGIIARVGGYESNPTIVVIAGGVMAALVLGVSIFGFVRGRAARA